MKTFSEKEEKLNSALEKLKNLNFVNPKLKEHTDYLDNKKNQLEIEKQQLEENIRQTETQMGRLKEQYLKVLGALEFAAIQKQEAEGTETDATTTEDVAS